jgi:hypothetical protein
MASYPFRCVREREVVGGRRPREREREKESRQ